MLVKTLLRYLSNLHSYKKDLHFHTAQIVRGWIAIKKVHINPNWSVNEPQYHFEYQMTFAFKCAIKIAAEVPLHIIYPN